MDSSKKTAGWLPVEDMQLRGEPELARTLGVALGREGREDRWTHGFHTYPAGLHPDAARDLLAICPEGPILDLFCGGGTTLVEALAAGREAFGQDLNPVAVRVSAGRTRLVDEAWLTRFRGAGRRITEAAKGWSELPTDLDVELLRPWYQRSVAIELEGLRQGIAAADEDLRPMLELCFSSLLIKVSHRRSDTSPKRVETQRPRHTTVVLFHKKVRELARRLSDLREGVPEGTPQPTLRLGDARSLKLEPRFAAVLTSPPYPAVYDYLRLQELRLAWLGLDLGKRDSAEISPRRDFRGPDKARAIKRWREDQRSWMKKALAALVPGGRLIVVIGDGWVAGKPIDTLEPVIDDGQRVGFELLASASGGRLDEGPGTHRREHVILLEKPLGPPARTEEAP